MKFDYVHVPRINLWRPYLYVRLVNESAGRKTNPVPMVVDTGADRCLFSAELAHSVGVNPTDGGMLSGTTGVGGSTTTAFTPIALEIPDLNITIRIQAEFTNGLPKGTNGLLGNSGFLDQFSSICFFPKKHEFSIET